MTDTPDTTSTVPEPGRDDGRRGRYPAHLVLWNLDDVVRMLGISRSTAYRHLKEKPWSHHRIGTDLKFSEADIEAIHALYKQPVPEPRRTPRVGTRANRARRNSGKDHL
ncbi:helix-turn-helix domain-containing protein [Arthrobacter globiformis]|uniref:helix-turn-helix domain-containing protein n=1 Tax=Arthrobacter globiformis TaxID=1665 RepID=UPI000B414879